MEMSRLTRDGTAEPVSRDQMLRRERDREMFIFPVQLTKKHEASRWVNCPKIKEEQNPYRTHLYRRKKTNRNKTAK